jgi:hypothetical protein
MQSLPSSNEGAVCSTEVAIVTRVSQDVAIQLGLAHPSEIDIIELGRQCQSMHGTWVGKGFVN